MTKSYSMTAKLQSDRGFTLLELLIVLSVLTIFLFSSTLPAHVFLYRDTQDNIIHTQTKVLFRRKGESVNLDASIERYAAVRFNEKGNVTVAQTLRFNDYQKIIILLGPGRMHE